MNIKKKIGLIPLLTIGIFIVGMVFVYRISFSTFNLLTRGNSVDYPFLQLTETLSPRLKLVQDNLKNAVSFNDKELLVTAEKYAAEFRDAVNSLKKIEGKAEIADKLLGRFNAYYSVAYESAAIMTGEKAGDAGEAIQKMVPALKELESGISEHSHEAEKSFRENFEKSRENVKHSLYVNTGVSLLIVAILLLISLIIVHSITRNLKKILDHTTRSENIDLTRKIQIDDNDEFAQIAGWINHFIENLHGSMSKVFETSRQVGNASSEMVKTNNSITEGSSRQMSEAEQIASAIEEIGTTINEVAANATDVAASATSAYTMAQESGDIIQDTISEMHKVADFVNTASGMVVNLGESSNKIGEITKVIIDISTQTNLLALNAAIEAARAGELGRGFAVVADEVRRLAERTTEATKTITEMVNSTQTETGNIVSCIESGKNLVLHGVEKANEAQSALQKILHAIDDVSGKTQQIASVTEEQSTTANAISSNIHKIVEISRHNFELTSDAAIQSKELNTVTGELNSIVNKFKIN